MILFVYIFICINFSELRLLKKYLYWMVKISSDTFILHLKSLNKIYININGIKQKKSMEVCVKLLFGYKKAQHNAEPLLMGYEIWLPHS